MDVPIAYAHKIALREDFKRFEQRAIYAAKVLNASEVGSHSPASN